MDRIITCRCDIGLLLLVVAFTGGIAAAPLESREHLLDKTALLNAQTFWDNRDFDWYVANIPFFECPDADIQTIYYYRWELMTKHLVYGSPNSGYAFTEFIDRPFWSGTYGAISCPAGHQLYEARWLRDATVARDYGRYWFRTPGAQPRRYSTWLADSVWAVHQVHPDERYTRDLLPDLVGNYEGWEKTHWTAEQGLFWQTGHDDGMEININSRQTTDTVRGAPGYRPTLNSYLWADALAIARIADMAGKADIAAAYRDKAATIKRNLQSKLWDARRQFFLQRYMRDETRDGHTIRANTLTYDSGRFAGSEHGREQIGYVPWQFNLPDHGAGYEAAWKFLMDRDYFYADYGPATVERHDPMFLISDRCCVWSGQSWPYATTQTLKAMANLLHHYKQDAVARDDYVKLLRVYAVTHRKEGRPYIAEAAHPDTGSWEGHDAYNHSEHYFHSGYVDLVITGLVGLIPQDDDSIVVDPLAPAAWEWFALDDLIYKGRRVSIVWDRGGSRYGLGKGLHIVANGKVIASSDRLERLHAVLPGDPPREATSDTRRVNFAVNNDGHYYPKLAASFIGAESSLGKVIDGNYWYHVHPPNRWSCAGSPNASDWAAIDFGVERRIDTVKLYVLDDEGADTTVTAPASITLQYWRGDEWATIPGQSRTPAQPAGHRANVIRFSPMEARKIRVVLTHGANGKAGLSEIEAWGEATGIVEPAPAPAGNLAENSTAALYPKATASHTSRFDKVDEAIDGKVNFNPEPRNRWTAYESPNESDWLEIDFGKSQRVGRIELGLYDDRGGVQTPAAYQVQYWEGDANAWRDAPAQRRSPAQPVGGQFNEVAFTPVETTKVRIVFTHRGRSQSGVTEVMVWGE